MTPINRRISPLALSLAATALTPRLEGLDGSAPPETLKIEWELPEYEMWREPVKPYVRSTLKQSRNSRCACGSGLKHKRCCGQNDIGHSPTAEGEDLNPNTESK